MVKFLLVSLFVMSQSITYAQWSVLSIPDALKVNSDAVIRRYVTDIRVYESDKIYVAEDVVITLFNADAFDQLISPWVVTNSIIGRKVNIKLYDAEGKRIRSNKGDVDAKSINNGKFLGFLKNKSNLIFPFTVELEYKNALLGINELKEWIPLMDYRISLQNASLRVLCNDTVQYDIKTNIPFVSKSVDEDGYFINIWEMNDLHAIDKATYEEQNQLHQLPTVCLVKRNK